MEKVLPVPILMKVYILSVCVLFWAFLGAEYIWRCILRQRVVRTIAVVLGIMSCALIFAEATLPFAHDLSLFSHLIKFAGQQEIVVQASTLHFSHQALF